MSFSYLEESPNERLKAFKKLVEVDIAGKDLEGEINYEETQVGQNYALLIIKTKNDKFEVRLYMDEDYQEFPALSELLTIDILRKLVRNLTEYPTTRFIENKVFENLEEAEDYIFNRKEELGSKLKNEKRVCRERFMPAECIKNPGKFLKPADHIRTWLVNNPFAGQLMHHDAIYIGEVDGKHYVIHVSNHCLSSGQAYKTKKEAHVRVGDFHKNFLSPTDKEVIVLVYPKRFRRREEIVCQAILLAAAHFGENKYHLLFENCQHFATYCSIGKISMIDKAPILKATTFVAVMTGMVTSVFGLRPGNWLDNYVKQMANYIREMFGTRPGEDSEEIKNATWKKVGAMFVILLSSEEDKEDQIKKVLDTNND